ncbi:MAG: PTS sugar transporter subunit IIA [Deltaproteobacteria bacterium]|nr:PTS sugar transporter subunit IIA [Deltaproteobacteria bacterium]
MKQSDLLSFFHEDLFIPELKASSKDGVLKEMASWLESKKKVYRTSIIYDLLKNREKLGSTGIGGGIAIPHCRSIAVEKLTVLFAIKSKGIDFKSTDKKSVKLFFMVAAPPQDVNYLVFLGKLVEVLTDKKIKKMLLKVKSFEEFKNIVSGVK